jgi:predicted metal-dependent hydrolase
MNFSYEVKRSKGRRVRISINRQGKVFLHIPRFIPEFVAKNFLLSKKDWIEKTLEKIKNFPAPVGGKRRNTRKEYLEKKEQARKLVQEKLIFWKNYYHENFGIDFNFKKVAIKNSKTRWGSCSSKKNLNFSYKIIYLDSLAQDYLIIHELSHLWEMNHSQNFWKLVSLGLPSYKNEKKKLKNSHLNLS